VLDLEPDDDLALIVETARKLASESLLPRMRETEAARGVDAATCASYEEIGLAGLELPESAGGAALGCVARVLVNEELGAADPGAALALDPIGVALYPVLELGGEAAVESLAKQLRAAGNRARACVVFAEDVDIEGDGERISASVPWVPAERVDALVWLGRDEALLVTDGIASTPVRGAGLRAAGAAELRLERAPIASRWTDPEAAGRARARTRLHAASLLLGIMRYSCEFSREYALERQAFGRPIAHHQALAFLITDMQMAVDGARLLVHEAAWRLDAGLPATAEAASAYAQCIEVARFVGPNGVQILGGHGFMADYPMEKTMREARATSLLYGGFDAAIEDAGNDIVARGAPVAWGMDRPSDPRTGEAAR
jgi:alkylation response protein AidB-like acyl-CoA dehydrogenase